MITKWLTSLLCGIALIGVSLGSALPAGAEQAPDSKGPGVARVSIIQGSAVVQRGDSNEQVTAAVNAPLLPGDYISTGETSRAELQFDGYTAVRLGGNVQARITNDDPSVRQLQLADGTVEVGVVHDARPVQIDTPSVSVRSQSQGDYRVSITKDGSSWVTVRSGRATIVTPQRSFELEQGKTLVARGSASDPDITYTSEVGYDSFDDFSAKRDRTMLAALNASPNVSPDIAGYDNLDTYGQWQDVAGYGQAWVPNQSSSWAPYQNGSWSWEDGYGWTWVSADPWGWAPYHYGRWTYANGYGWAWVPPAYVGYYSPQPAWSPALVGFFGFGLSVGGPGWGVNLGFGGYPGIGWYPLAPYAPYYPWYPGWAWTGYGWGWGGCCGWGYGRWGYPGWGTHVVNITHINNYYGNFAHHGVTGTLTGNFAKGDFHHNISVDPHDVSRVGTIHGALPVTPTRDNLAFGHGTVHAPVTMSKAFDSPRFASNRALSAHPSFDAQQHAVSQAIHGDTGRESAPVSRDGAESRGAETRGNVTAGHESAPVSHENAPTSSWQRFDQSRGTAGRSETDRGSLESNHGSLESNHGSLESNHGSLETSRNDHGTSDSWNRFTQTRGSVSSSSERDSYGGADRSAGYSRGSAEGSYGHGSYPSYSRGSAEGSYGHSSYPSYARGSAEGSYGHSSYPSYSRGSSYGSYGSNSRGGSYPSYSRGSSGSYGSYARPSGGGSYSRPSGGGSYARPSGGGGSAPHPSGGGGHNGGGRPPG
ncbi:MAG TPA: DUF6600 domain-containing protein [Candidatus Cybelea sp.]|nr:DUF6600 domain-containing protein [Candidatus Cybelea sp.]